MSERSCSICGRLFPETELIPGVGIRNEIEQLIRADHPSWSDASFICRDDFDTFRIRYISGMIEDEKGSIQTLERAVIESIRGNDILAFSTAATAEPLSLGERLADRVAAFGGSWTFIGCFFAVLAGWIGLNASMLFIKPFDPFPFILLNLILSCLAAIQAPIIMMSQNRVEAKDRLRAENDYKINLKSEIEVRTLHEKVDHLLLDQWSKMMKIQEIQIEILEEIRRKLK